MNCYQTTVFQSKKILKKYFLLISCNFDTKSRKKSYNQSCIIFKLHFQKFFYNFFSRDTFCKIRENRGRF